MMSEYRRGWALRYLREAKAELEAARNIPYMAPSLLLEAIRKARNAIYYSLGEPAYIEILVREEIGKPKPANDSILRFLIEIEDIVQQLRQIEEINGELMMKQADTLVQVASEFVETLTEEKIEN
jgi:flagellar biosynthesis/type III secretory pathway chaperone